MNDISFLMGLGGLLAFIIGWGFKYLPGERWQMLAVVPLKKDGEKGWQGINLTYYGFFIATSQFVSILLLLILLRSAHISILGAAVATAVILALCLPAARIVAMIVEHKRHTFTIGGASFVGIILAPWIILGVERLGSEQFILPMLPVLAAMSISYTLGEGLGRLGCISYGCCYGKPIDQCAPLARMLFTRANFIFTGENKKVAYEAGLCGTRLVPIQAITCLLYSAGALAGSYLFLHGRFAETLLLTMVLTQLWRILSETMRADFRGFGKISVYQKMGLASVVYVGLICLFVEVPEKIVPNIVSGLDVVWNPWVIGGMQLLWVVFFIYFGRSTVTRSTVIFNIVRENI